MTPAERAATDRFLAGCREYVAARERLTTAVAGAAVALRRFGDAWQSSINAELAGHPDMAELNVRMDALYGD